MKKILFFSLGFACCLLPTSGCDDSNVGPDNGGISLYYNSFETNADTVGWRGHGTMSFRSEAPPGGGRQSVCVSGGCASPHAVFDLPPSGKDRLLELRCWGKGIGEGGYAALVGGVFSGPADRIEVRIAESEWTPYRSKTLNWPANEPITLEIGGSGFLPGAALIDLLEVRVVE